MVRRIRIAPRWLLGLFILGTVLALGLAAPTTRAGVDDVSSVVVFKACVPNERAPGMFTLVIGGDTASVPCGRGFAHSVLPDVPITVGEAPVPAGFTATITCNGAPPIAGGTTTVTPVMGQQITCTVTNTVAAPPTLREQIQAQICAGFAAVQPAALRTLLLARAGCPLVPVP